MRPSFALGGVFRQGDIFLTGSGSLQEYTPTGELVQTLPGTTGAGAICFDPTGNYLVLPGVGLFDDSGNELRSNWAQAPDGGHCVIDRSGDVYVSNPLSSAGATSGTFTKYDLRGKPIDTFTVSPILTVGQPLAIDLAPDGCTMYVGSWDGLEGTAVRIDVCTDLQKPWVAGYTSIDDLRVLPNGQVIVTDDPAGVLLDAAGHVVRKYIPGGQIANGLRFMALDPDGTSFWMSTVSGNGVVRYDIASGALLAEWGIAPNPITAGAGGAIAVYGGPLRSPPPASAPNPPNLPNPPGPPKPPGTTIITAKANGVSCRGSASRVTAALSAILAPHGRTGKVHALLSHSGYSFTWMAPCSGRLTIFWYQVTPGAHVSRHHRFLVASVSRKISRSARVTLKVVLTPAGTKLLRSARELKLNAVGSFTRNGQHAATVSKRFTLTA